MGDASTPLPESHPFMKAWTAWKQTEAYRAVEGWPHSPAQFVGFMWAAFEAGFNAAAPPAGSSEVGDRAVWEVNEDGSTDIEWVVSGQRVALSLGGQRVNYATVGKVDAFGSFSIPAVLAFAIINLATPTEEVMQPERQTDSLSNHEPARDPVTGAAPVEASACVNCGHPAHAKVCGVVLHTGTMDGRKRLIVCACGVDAVAGRSASLPLEASTGVAADVELEHDEEPERNPGAAAETLDLTKWHPDFIPCSIEGDSPDGGHCRPLGNDERIIITAGQLRHMGAKPEIWPEYEEPATGRYDEIVKDLDKWHSLLSVHVTDHSGAKLHPSECVGLYDLCDRAASALREAQQQASPATGQYAETAEVVDAALGIYKGDQPVIAGALISAARALRGAQQRIAELETKG